MLQITEDEKIIAMASFRIEMLWLSVVTSSMFFVQRNISLLVFPSIWLNQKN